MSNKRHSEDFDLDSMGIMPTMKRQVMGNGMITSVSDEHSIWLYAKVPLVPVADARDTQRLLSAYMPLYDALSDIAKLTPRSAIKRRSASKNSYRRIHLLRTSVPKVWEADIDAPRQMRHGQQNLNRYLNSVMHGEITRESVLLLGVELAGSMTAGGLKNLLESFTYTLVEGGTPLSDYDHDLERLNRIFARAGLNQPSPADIAAADSWWNPGSNPDVPTLAHPEHMHVIRDSRTVRSIARLEEDGVDCEEWPDDLTRGMGTRAGQSMVSFGSVADIELEFIRPDDPRANWLIPLMDAGALATSIRGSLEPQQMTRAEIRRNRRNYLNDRAEQQQHGRMSRGEQEEKVARLQQIEDVYAGGHGSPTLVESSVLVAMDGKIRDFGAIETAAEIRPMEHRQDKSWVEMMIASTVKANPNIHDMPIQNIAASGIQDASRSGDRHGILRGFAERDGTPVYTNPQEAYNEEDAPPVSINCGSSGSGKASSLREIIKTPSGNVLMGDLKVGDIVYGRDGKPCHVLEIFDHAAKTIDAYKLRLSDGQVLTVDSNHQFVVSDFRARNYRAAKKHQSGIARRKRLMDQVEALRELAVQHTDEQQVDAQTLAQKVAPIVDESTFSNAQTVRSALRMVDIEPVAKAASQPKLAKGFTAEHETKVYDVRQLLERCIEDWTLPITKHEAKNQQWKDAVEKLAESHSDQLISSRELRDGLVAAGSPLGARFIADSVTEVAQNHDAWHDGGKAPKPRYYKAEEMLGLLHDVPVKHRGHPFKTDAIEAAQKVAPFGGRAHIRRIAKMMVDAGMTREVSSVRSDLGLVAKKYKVPFTTETVEVENHDRMSQFGGAKYLYQHRKALLGLSIRLEQIAQNTLLRTSDDDEQVLSVGEMLGRGLKADNAGSQFAIKLTQPVQGTHRDLPMDPYVFGVWLGDGATDGFGSLVSPEFEILDRIESVGYDIRRGSMNKETHPENWCVHYVTNWGLDLNKTGAVGDKHIPTNYATASVEQRFELLRGLMDSDGSIDKTGSCELSLSHQRLAEDALDLIRSLGIKASLNVNTAGYRDADGVYVQTKDRHRIHFTTDQPVFWLPRKAQRLPETVRGTNQWLYIESIEPAESEPMRCITVDSVDSTYLMAGYVPNHNTMLMQWEAFQADKLGYPQVIIDPKRDSDLTPTVESMDNGRVFGLDRLAEENGIFDPIKYASTIEVGIEMAISNLAELNPYGSTIEMSQAEPLLQYALRYGAEKGHTSTLTALRRAVADAVIEPSLVERIEMMSQSSPLFQALVGSDDDTVGLRVHDGTTLIMAGQQELDLPAPGQPPKSINQRITTALIRNIVQGSSMALTGRNGIIRLDEAWVFLSSNPEELIKLGRLARSQGTDVNLYTQRVTDITNANLNDSVTRGVILHLKSVDEARAACEIFGLEPTPERIGRITAAGTLDDDESSPNYNSLRALRDPQTGGVVRGTVAIDVDIHGRAVPVEIRIPQSFLRMASTRASDVAQRKEMDRASA
ncbi:hypothetical protein GCM10009720_09340 [Yaniella flava]|uniref:DOD-type homing endonuclease domain-containing protein n=1 Tax=Yaniella flava TaxID=287930 RepID=A0ABN2U788_9MICC